MKRVPAEFLKRIPKADLHVHLDGSLRLSTLIELAKKEGVELPDYTEKGLRQKVFKDKYASLVEYLEYLKGFSYTGAVMQNAENIERIAYELGQDAIAEGVRYLEVRFAPQLHANDKLTAQEAVRAVVRGLQRAQKEHNSSAAVKKGDELEFYFGVIACAMRNFNQFMSPYYAGLMKALSQSSKSEIFGIASLELAKMVVKLAKKEGVELPDYTEKGLRQKVFKDKYASLVEYSFHPQDRSLRRSVWAGIYFPSHYRLLRQPPGPRHAFVCRGYD